MIKSDWPMIFIYFHILSKGNMNWEKLIMIWNCADGMDVEAIRKIAWLQMCSTFFESIFQQALENHTF